MILILAILGIACMVFAQWTMNESFESTSLPTGWTIHDEGDGMVWRPINNPSHAHTGNYAMVCDDYLPHANHDWLITPQIHVNQGDSLYFYTRAWISTENLKVYVSTTGAAYTNFTTQIVNLQNIGTTYQLSQTSLNAYAGQNIYIGFLFEATNYGLLIDDFKFGHPSTTPPTITLPDSYTFIQGESLNVDFTSLVTTTNINTASLTVSGNTNVNVAINGLNVTFTSPTWIGTENLTFTIHDNSNGLQGTDDVQVIVNPVPSLDLGLQQVLIPRNPEYLSHEIFPSVTVTNTGDNAYSNAFEVSCNIADSMGTSQYNHTVSNPGNLAVDQTVTVNFTQFWMPTVTGTYTVTFTIVTADGNPLNNTLTSNFPVVYRVMEGGPDNFGYRWIDSNAVGGPAYTWTDISSTGLDVIMNGVNAFSGDDNFCEPISFGFPFPFYGTEYLQFYADTNGELLLAPNNWYSGYPDTGWQADGNMFNYMFPIPGYVQMPGLIAAYWDDLQADQGTGDIYFQSFGTAPNRYAIIQWNNFRFHAGSGGSPILKFQVVLYENGEIIMNYNTTQNGVSGTNAPHNNGRSATVAIQNETGNIGLCYLREIVQNQTYIGVQPAGNLLHDGLSIRFYSGEDTQPPVITHAQPGNTFQQNLTLQNHIVDSSNITAAVLHYNYNGTWQTIQGTQVANFDFSYTLPTLPLGVTLQYYFTASDEHGNSSSSPASAPDSLYMFKILPTADTHILLLYSGGQDYTGSELAVYENVLNSLRVSYDIYDWQEYASYAIPAQYRTVLCYAVSGYNGPTCDNLCAALMNFMDSGTNTNIKNVFFSSDEWAFGQAGMPNSNIEKKLCEAYFRISYIPTGFGGGTNGLAGPDAMGYASGTILDLANSHIGTAGNEFNVYASSPDCIFESDGCPDWYADQVQNPEIGSNNAFAFEDGPIDGQAYLYHGVCAVWLDNLIYRSFYFSFDYSQLSNTTQRTQFMHDLLDWFGTGTANDDPVTIVPKTALMQNFPNPFNPVTNIEFSTSSKSSTKLEVYNVKGQLVKTLVNGTLPVGNHQVTWNGTDNQDHSAASGVYFYRLSNGNSLITKRMVLLK
ncbi:MAG TPA: choice-of-anchor J domain-containing protein [Candidatus Cloacimonadota bacterium]|nr:choice-of-anchor J domain-containing protein [Candidatus Cloacimonadota bacterium]